MHDCALQPRFSRECVCACACCAILALTRLVRRRTAPGLDLRDCSIIKELFNRTDKADEGTLAECFVSISYPRGDVFPLMQYFIGDEFMSGGIAGALMRENVIASKLIKAYIST